MQITITVFHGDNMFTRKAESFEIAEQNLESLKRMVGSIEYEKLMSEATATYPETPEQLHDCHASPESGCEGCPKQA